MPYFDEFPVWKDSLPYYPYAAKDNTMTSYAEYFDHFLSVYEQKSRFWHPSEGNTIVEFIKTCIDLESKTVKHALLIKYIYDLLVQKSHAWLGIRPKIAEQLLLSIVTIYASVCVNRKDDPYEVQETNHYLSAIQSHKFCYTRLPIPKYVSSSVPIFETYPPDKPQPKPAPMPKPIIYKFCVMCGRQAGGQCPQCGKYLCDGPVHYGYDYHAKFHSCRNKHPCLI